MIFLVVLAVWTLLAVTICASLTPPSPREMITIDEALPLDPEKGGSEPACEVPSCRPSGRRRGETSSHPMHRSGSECPRFRVG
jgi:hypothetical protein